MREFEKRKMSDFEKYLRSRVDIVSIVSKYVTLTKKGNNYMGRCPFHPENINKNLIVFPRIQAFKCRSVEACNGDVFDFIAKYKSVNRDEAIKILATEIGVYANIFREVPVTEEAPFEMSFSSLKLFQQCPQRYKYRYIDKKADQKSTYYLVIGRTIHKTLADFFMVKQEDRSLNKLLSIFNSNWRDKGISNVEEKTEIRNQCEEMLEDYFRNTDCKTQTYRVEVPIKCKYKNTIITGTVDRIDIISKNECEIIEYKTEPMESIDDDINKMQLAFYYQGVIESYGLPVSKLTLAYLGSSTAMSYSPQELGLEKQLSRAYEIVKQILNTTDFHPQKNKYCMDCDLANVCPEFRGGNAPMVISNRRDLKEDQ